MEEKLYALIDRYLDGELSGEERARMEMWLNQLHLAQEVVPDWHDSDKETSWRKIQAGIRQGERRNAPDASVKRERTIVPMLWLAAVFMVCSMLLPLVVTQTTPATTVMSNPGKIILSDGTILWLREESELRYPSRFSSTEREVFLRGEALFEVSRDRRRPFLIRCDDYTARVIGTSFSIRTTANDIEVVVLTGSVMVSPTSSTDTTALTVLHPNERAVFSRVARVVTTTTVADKDLRQITSQTEYVMRFEDAAMTAVLKRVEQKFNVSISHTPGVATCRLSADFTDQSLETTLTMISEALNLRYNIQGHEVVLTGEGCKH